MEKFSLKRFFINLGLAVGVWLVSAIYQGVSTFGKYIGTFSSGCQITGYPIDICYQPFYKIQPLFAILLNIFFWYWIIHFFLGWIGKRNNE